MRFEWRNYYRDFSSKERKLIKELWSMQYNDSSFYAVIGNQNHFTTLVTKENYERFEEILYAFGYRIRNKADDYVERYGMKGRYAVRGVKEFSVASRMKQEVV